MKKKKRKKKTQRSNYLGHFKTKQLNLPLNMGTFRNFCRPEDKPDLVN